MFRLMHHLQLGMATLLFSSFVLGGSPSQAKPTQTVKPNPAPETLITPDDAVSLPPAGTQIAPVNGTVTVKLVNKTNAAINYQAVGDTEFRTLAGAASITLQKLKTPITLSAYRQDRGFLNMMLKVIGNKTQALEITLDATTDFSADKTIIRIESTGLVFVY
jgi:hypothetical protein